MQADSRGGAAQTPTTAITPNSGTVTSAASKSPSMQCRNGGWSAILQRATWLLMVVMVAQCWQFAPRLFQ